MRTIKTVLLIFLFAIVVAGQASGTGVYAPEELEKWKDWVLHDKSEFLCPSDFRGNAPICAWPSRLKIMIMDDSGDFEQTWTVFADTWAPLPGNRNVWPVSSSVDNVKVPIIEKQGIPSVFLKKGVHRVKGSFKWKERPRMIRTLPSAGIVSLFIKGLERKNPFIDNAGMLWIDRQEGAKVAEDRIEVRIFRLIDDSIPMKITDVIKIAISGKAREIALPSALVPGTSPMSIKSSLPARIGRDGTLNFQARPGTWTFRIESRLNKRTEAIGPAKAEYGAEIWSFKSENHLRIVEATGLSAIEPKQTSMPSQWRQYPAYLADSGDTLKFKELKRGDPDPSPDRLKLQRTFWLDFDGKGYTVKDELSGSVNRLWRLSMDHPGKLGRVTMEGDDRLITWEPGSSKSKSQGVEVRNGKLSMTAVSRYEDLAGEIPAVGWGIDFEEVKASVNLPPGWRLIHAGGVDGEPATWINQWTLLDFFLVLIIAIGVFKLRGAKWGVLALFTMALIFHEQGAPKLVILNLLAVIGLLKVLPDGFARKLVNIWGFIAVAVLAALSISFIINQARWGVYPQLEPTYSPAPWSFGNQSKNNVDDYQTFSMSTQESSSAKAESNMIDDLKQEYKKAGSRLKKQSPVSQGSFPPMKKIQRYDPNALVQTGPGLPSWSWRRVNFKWNGPVDKDLMVGLTLVPPGVNTIICFTRIGLLLLFIICLVDVRKWSKAVAKGATGLAALLLLVPVLMPMQAEAGDFPPDSILKQYKARLLEKPDCLPSCADIALMNMSVSGSEVKIDLDIHAAIETAIPLPGSRKFFSPDKVLIDGKKVKAMIRKGKEGTLFALVPKGVHRATIIGTIGTEDTIRFPMVLQPRYARVRAPGWDVQGIGKDGRPGSSIQLTRKAEASDDNSDAYKATRLPPFFMIRRTITLGLEWRIRTKVIRATPRGTPVSLKVPLLEGESVASANVTTEGAMALINMPAHAKSVSWTSTIKRSNSIKLTAPKDVPWVETWILDASEIWHVDYSGIPVIFSQNSIGVKMPEWRPWPGESIAIDISRPEPVSGKTVTIDSASINYTPGKRFATGTISLEMRAGKGERRRLLLPKEAKLLNVQINGKEQPIRQEGRKVAIPLRPGKQSVKLEWRQPVERGILTKGPEFNIGGEAVNIEIKINMPENLWILWTSGPTMGPAILFWSYLFVVCLAATALGRITITPLRTVHWLLLGIGLTQVSPLIAVVIAGWFLALGYRARQAPSDKWPIFNFLQVLLVVWGIFAMKGIYSAIKQGLLDSPRIQITGNGSWGYKLTWDMDRIAELMPQPVVISVPLLAYKILMLLWALWIAFYLLKWLQWAWTCFSTEKIWQKSNFFTRRKKTNPQPPPIPVATPADKKPEADESGAEEVIKDEPIDKKSDAGETGGE